MGACLSAPRVAPAPAAPVAHTVAGIRNKLMVGFALGRLAPPWVVVARDLTTNALIANAEDLYSAQVPHADQLAIAASIDILVLGQPLNIRATLPGMPRTVYIWDEQRQLLVKLQPALVAVRRKVSALALQNAAAAIRARAPGAAATFQDPADAA